MLPERFREIFASEWGADECNALCEALEAPATVSVRIHPKKGRTPAGATPIPWSPYGYYLPERPIFTTDPAFHAGAYYVQEPSSQFVGRLLDSAVGDSSHIRLLDLCAAPGGKTTLYSSALGDRGLVVANEINRQRAAALTDNVRKWGEGNVVVTCNDPAHFAGFEGWFDVVAVDAPCSGEGMFRRIPESRDEWSPGNVTLCAQRQLKILNDIWPSLRAGGTLIYSTCTFNRTEDEGVLRQFQEEFGSQIEAAPEVAVDPAWGIVTGREGTWQTFRFFPHRARGEGFFAAIIRKSDNAPQKSRTPKSRRRIIERVDRRTAGELSRWVTRPETMEWYSAGDSLYGSPGTWAEDIRTIAESLSTIHSGVRMGQIFKGELKPDHSLAMYVGLNRAAANCTEVGLPQALDYLKRAALTPGPDMSEGINLLTYEGLALGWIKRVGNRTNNLYPNSLRILNF